MEIKHSPVEVHSGVFGWWGHVCRIGCKSWSFRWLHVPGQVWNFLKHPGRYPCGGLFDDAWCELGSVEVVFESMRAPCTSGSSLWTTHWCRGLPLTCEDVRGCPRKIQFSHHDFPCFTARHARRRDLCRYPGRILREIWDWNFWALGIWDGIVQLPAAQELLRHPGKQPRNVVYPSILMFSIYVHRIFRGSQPIAWIASFIRIF